MLEHEIFLRVRYAETDQMGYCYYGNYAQYYEVGRVELIRSLGYSYKDFELKYDVLMPVVSLNIRYLRPAKYDDLLRVVTSVRKLPDKKITFYTDIFNEQGELLNSGTVKLGFITSKNMTKGIFAPEFLLEKLRPYFEHQGT